ncbi:MAG: PD-(D/E)XK nuclease family protein [Elusimicrobiota bacterium]|jgi:hypothetical protein
MATIHRRASLFSLPLLLLSALSTAVSAQQTRTQVAPVAPGAASGIAGIAAAQALKTPDLGLKIGNLAPTLMLPQTPLLRPSALTLPAALPAGMANVNAAPTNGAAAVSAQMQDAAAVVPAASSVRSIISADPGAAPMEKSERVDTRSLLARILPKLDFSAFSPAKLKDMSSTSAREAGGRLMDRVLGLKSAARTNGVADVSADAAAPAAAHPAAKLEKPFDPLNRPYTNFRLNMFENDPEAYALTFLFGVEESGSKGYELLVGLAVHETLEHIYTWVKEGAPGKDITLEKVLAEYAASWDRNLKAGHYRSRTDFKPSEYKRRGIDFITRRFQALAPFDKGQILGLEERVLWTMKDPVTGKSYDFKGKIDRLMVEDGAVVIHDWKTHFNPPSIRQLQQGDYQLGLYALGLARSRPDLLQGRRIKLVWDFKEFSQEIVVDEAYLQRVEAKIFDVLRRMDNFTERVQAERAEWLKRLKPEARPSGLVEARAAADRIGVLDGEIGDKGGELKKLRAEYDRLEEAVLRYAKGNKLSSVAGRKRTLSISEKSSRGLPTKSDDSEGYEAVVAALKAAGRWEEFSSVDLAALKRMAEVRGGDDGALFEKLRELLGTGFSHSIEAELRDDAPRRGGSVKVKDGPAVQERPEMDAMPGLLSPTQLATFLADRDDYVKRYLLGRRADAGAKPMGMLAGSSIHETVEQLFTWIKGGRPISEIQIADLLKVFEQRWKALRDTADYRPEGKLTATDYKRGARNYLRGIWKRMYPFEQGRTVYLESRMHFDLTDPETGRVYRFQGIADRIMIDGDTVVIRDWKSHYVPPSDEEVRAKDYQLGLYVLAMHQLYPDLMKGRKARLIWDFKDKSTVIEVDDAYIADLKTRLFKILRGMDALGIEVRKDRAAWEERLLPPDLPKNKTEAGRRVDRMGELSAHMDKLKAEVDALKAERAEHEAALIDFTRRTGRVVVDGKRFDARLIKTGVTTVPTKTADREAHEKVAAILKASGAWEKYSSLNYAALKKALSDPKNPDKALLKVLEPLMKDLVKVEASLSEISRASAAAKPAKTSKSKK